MLGKTEGRRTGRQSLFEGNPVCEGTTRRGTDIPMHSTLQYSCLGNPMDGGAWWATIHGVPKRVSALLTVGPASLHKVWNWTRWLFRSLTTLRRFYSDVRHQSVIQSSIPLIL